MLEEIDADLEFDCSSQESSDTESEETQFADSIDPETCSRSCEENKIDSIIAKSTRPTKNSKTKTGRNENGNN